MRITMGRNTSSLRVLRALSSASGELSRSYERLSSGQRINRPSDDAAGLSVATSLRARSRIFTQAVRNLSDGTSLLSIADQALGTLSSIVTRQRELAAQASNGALSTSQRNSLDEEAQALRNEYLRILNTTSFNGRRLLSGDTSSLSLQAGVGMYAPVRVEIAGQEQQVNIENLNGATSMAYGAYTASPLSDPKFLVVPGDNGKSTLIALSFARHSGGNLHFLVQSYRVGASGALEVVSQYAQNTGLAWADVEASGSASFTAGDSPFDDGNYIFEFFADNGSVISTSERQFSVANDGTLSGFGSTALVFANSSQASVSGNFSGLSGTESVSAGNGSLSINYSLLRSTLSDPVSSLNLASFSLATRASALLAMESLESQLTEINTTRARLGAGQSRLYAASSQLQAMAEQLTGAVSRIIDSDSAEDVTRTLRVSAVQQTATAVLAQANLQPSLVIRLISGVESDPFEA